MKKVFLSLGLVAGMFILNSCGDDNKNCAKTWYQDLDGDGLGNAAVMVEECVQPDGYVEDNTDILDKVVEEKSMPIMFKITGETCYYCGDWGWDGWKNLAAEFNGKAFVWSNYGAGFSNNHFRSQEINPTMDAFEGMFEDGGGKPNFATNGVDYSTSMADARNAANGALSVPSGLALEMSASNDEYDITVNTAVEFFDDLDGEYYVAAYVIEDKAMGPQSGPAGAGQSEIAHYMVMRGSMSPSAWGVELTSGNTAAGTIMKKSFNVTVPASYDLEHLKYGVVVWKKDGVEYSFVNSTTNQWD